MAELIIQNPSITTNVFEYDEAGRVSAISGHPLAGEGGGTVVKSDLMWKPTVGSDGYVHWSLASSATTPEAAYISGAQGPQGPSGTNGKDGTNGVDGISPTFTITPTAGGTHVTISGAQGEEGFDVLSGAKGADGTAGFAPLFTITDVDIGTYPQGGKHVAIQYGDGGLQNTAFDIFNGIDGTGATVNIFGNNGIGVTQTGSNYTLGLSGGVNVPSLSAGYAQNATSAVSADVAMNYYDTTDKAPINLSQAINALYTSLDSCLYISDLTPNNGISGTWDDDEEVYTFGIDTTNMTANKQYAFTTTGWAEVNVPSTSGYLPLSGGTVSGSTYFSAANGQNMLAVASAATLIGASRQTSEHFGQDANALGTTWIGVGGAGMYRGFLKYTQGGNVGDLDSGNTMQVEFTPNNKGTIFAKAKNSGNDCPETQILNPVKTTCDNMTTSGIDSNNMSGPNYMIAKNADGQFVIGAAVFNCQGSLPGTLQPNTYYFVY